MFAGAADGQTDDKDYKHKIYDDHCKGALALIEPTVSW